ncbi:MAG: nuclear transport factor 2 family protein [Acidobacteriota bacterium]
MLLIAAVVLAAGGFAAGFIACLQDQRVTGGRHAVPDPSNPGDASPQARAGVRASLQAFQEGYLKRDPGKLDSFMRNLFDGNADLLVLGTDESEWVRGYPEVARFVRNDWTNWGELQLRLDDAIVNASGDVAWATAPGVVRFGRAARPIRFTAVLTRKQGQWRFRHLQFQWDDHEPTASDLLDPATYAAIARVGLGRLASRLGAGLP